MNKIKFSRAVALFVMMVMLGGTLFASVVRVAYGASLSITPPLIRIALVPGDIWHSTFQVTNSGSDAVTVMIETAHVDTKDAGSKFTPVFLPPEDRRGVLSGWITMGASEARIEAGETKSIPLTIIIPKDASPGGHYATILVGLKPDAVSSSRTAIGVTSKLAAIVAVRVAGDVIESMGIKEFSTEHVFYPDFPVRLTLWMKNLGNTHVEPNVIVRVTNFWGKFSQRIHD